MILEATPTPTLPLLGGGSGEALAGGGKEEVPLAGGGEKEIADTVAALHGAVRAELAAFKSERAQLKGQPLGLLARERAARTLAGLTATLQRLQVMRATLAAPAGDPEKDTAYDDMPADLDEFRAALARRIETFLASRPDEGGAARAADRPADEAQS
jgi:hypothetical protein